MADREAPIRDRRPKQSVDARGARAPQAATRHERCRGAAAQLAAIHRVLRVGPALQLRAGGAAAGAQPAAGRPVAANCTGLPDRLKAGVEALSGVSLDGVKVHYNSSKPAQLNAHAYAQGSDIHLAPGQERHLPHEAWHIVQQAQGRVKPTLQLKSGAFVNDDAGLEREADLLGAKALGNVVAGPAPASGRPPGAAAPVQRRSNPVIQAALVNPVYAGGTKPTTVTLTLAQGDYPPAGSAPGAASPDGWAQIIALGQTQNWVRFHVLNQRSGGAGVANNLVPTTRQINQNAAWKTFETSLKIFVDPEHSQGMGAPFASTFTAAVGYHTAAHNCIYQSAAANVAVRGIDFPAVIAATLDVPAQPGLAHQQHAATLRHGDGLLRPNEFAPAGWVLAAAAPAAAPAAPAAAPAAPAVAPAVGGGGAGGGDAAGGGGAGSAPMQMMVCDPGERRLEPVNPGASAVTQLRGAGAAPARPASGAPNRTGLPDRLKAGVETLSGVSLDGVKVHYNSAKPTRLDALAYAQGSDIHLGPGQERHLPHEAWHVVQQAQGRVKPTRQMKGEAINDESGLEREADTMGGRAARIKVPISGPELLARGPALQSTQLKVIQRGTGSSKSDEEAVNQAEYGKYVAKAVGLLKGKIGFGASPQGKYDKRYWKAIEDPTYKLAIEATVKPSEAIKALFEAGSGVWEFDCAEFVQICNLYATMKLYGEEQIDSTKLVLRQHGSTPFENAGVTFERKAKGNAFDAIFKKAKNAYLENLADEATLLDNAPAGSRVCFKNPAGEGTPFRNENAIALGGGTYAAHPMGTGLTAADIVDRLVDYNQRLNLGGEDNGRSEIFVSQVEIFPSMPMGAETKKALGLDKYEKFI